MTNNEKTKTEKSPVQLHFKCPFLSSFSYLNDSRE